MTELTPGQLERIAMLAEECNEIAQVAMKIARFGYDSYHPDAPNINNTERLISELHDLFAISGIMVAKGDIPPLSVPDDEMDYRMKRKISWMRHFKE